MWVVESDTISLPSASNDDVTVQEENEEGVSGGVDDLEKNLGDRVDDLEKQEHAEGDSTDSKEKIQSEIIRNIMKAICNYADTLDCEVCFSGCISNCHTGIILC